jgi:DNA-binding transcriptional LysR family regulator
MKMELRHLRCFVAVAEELHFARAAERLHIEQSPLSRAIKELEYDLGVRLFERTTRSTRLTWTGQVFLEDVRRIFAALDQAKSNVKAAATGYHGTLRIALSDAIPPSRLASLLARSRAEEPEVEIRLFQTPLSQQVKGLRDDQYDAGFAQAADVGDGIIVEPVWTDSLVVAVPARHPLLSHKHVPLEAVLRYPLVLCHPETCEGSSRQIERILRTVNVEPQVAEYVTTHDLLLTLIAAGYGVGLTTSGQIAACRHPEVVARPIAGEPVLMTTYLLRPDIEPSAQLSNFIDRANPLEPAPSASPDGSGMGIVDEN